MIERERVQSEHTLTVGFVFRVARSALGKQQNKRIKQQYFNLLNIHKSL
jgi:hypothetical protein